VEFYQRQHQLADRARPTEDEADFRQLCRVKRGDLAARRQISVAMRSAFCRSISASARALVRESRSVNGRLRSALRISAAAEGRCGTGRVGVHLPIRRGAMLHRETGRLKTYAKSVNPDVVAHSIEFSGTTPARPRNDAMPARVEATPMPRCLELAEGDCCHFRVPSTDGSSLIQTTLTDGCHHTLAGGYGDLQPPV
jgi:uncharacterized low-complexity protein